MLFKYTAVDRQGNAKEDQIEAVSYSEAARIIHQKGLIPTELKEKRAAIFELALIKFSGVSLQDKILFVQNLAIMYKAGISISRSLKILANQARNHRLKAMMDKISADVESGKTLAESLGQYPDTFPNIFISMIRVGELSGNLDKSLEYLGIQLQREHNLISKARGAMIYPSVIVLAVIIVGILMSIFVLPSLTAIFEDSKLDLPPVTKMVIAFSNFMSKHTFLAIGLMFGSIVAFYAALRTPGGKKYFDKALLRVPIIGALDKKINLARFSRMMGSMLKSGTPILEGLEVVSESLGNGEYRESVRRITLAVKVGKTMASSMSNEPRLFPYIVSEMVGVGEESGRTEDILDQLAAHYEEEVDDSLKNMSSIIEPLLILFIGSIVGVLALALISPIYQLTSQAGN